jgi:hypothetical protein
MLKMKDSKKSALTVLWILVLGAGLLPLAAHSSTCAGSDPCHACKNCKYCKHCAKDGGKCGVCK